MLFKQASQGDERAFVTFKNVEATSITTGQGVALRIGTSASFDGISAVRATSATTADLPGFLGVATRDCASNSFGFAQIYGNVSSVLISNQNTSITINTGDPLIPGALVGSFASAVPSYAASGFGYVICSNAPTNTTSQAAPMYTSGFVRAIH